jgi:hypothetical protein
MRRLVGGVTLFAAVAWAAAATAGVVLVFNKPTAAPRDFVTVDGRPGSIRLEIPFGKPC